MAQKKIPLVYRDEKGLHELGTVTVDSDLRAHSLILETEEGDISTEIHVIAQLNEKYRHLFSAPASDFSIETPLTFRKPPCEWKNSNICVAEGCFGESCLKENPSATQ